MATSIDTWKRITVDDLKEEIGVPDDQLNQRCTKKHLRKIALFVENFNAFATKFEMPPAVLKGIETNQNLKFVQKVEAVFVGWHDNISNATYRSFMQVCIELEEGGLAREMCRLCAEGVYATTATQCSMSPTVENISTQCSISPTVENISTQCSMSPTVENISTQCFVSVAVESKATQCSMEIIRPASVCNEATQCSMDRTPSTLESRNILTVPITRNITHKSVKLKWIPPDLAVECYTVFYHQQKDPDNTLKRIFVDGQADHYLIDGLTYNTRYVFKLQATLSTGMSLESDETDVVRTLFYLPLDMQSKSKLLSKKTEEQPAIYELTKKKIMENQDKRLAKYEVGQPIQYCPEKVLMIVGATGAGKTTLINAFANYMYGVQWDDDFRFVLVDNEPKKSQAHSQTSWITAYTLHRAPDSPVPYSLTIIDTPGFGDTEGIKRDKKIFNQIKDFFFNKTS